VILLSVAPAGAVVTSGKALALSDNYDGQLGNGASGDGTDVTTPTPVSNLSAVKSVKAGCSHGLALKNDGTVRAWGANYYGELGNGAKDPTYVPVKMKIDDVKATSAGCSHGLSLKENGTVKSWGDNVTGQLGNGASLPGADKTVPVRVVNLTGVEAMATGGYHSLALLGSGKVKSWGSNSDGQLGNGTSGTNRRAPGDVIGLDNVRSISGGESYSLAVLESGSARAWGHNFEGQLGNGTFNNFSDVPAAVKNLTSIKNIDGGYQFTLAAAE
jgi:alpha-tubulin suppressor-like RCC1 family protein